MLEMTTGGTGSGLPIRGIADNEPSLAARRGTNKSVASAYLTCFNRLRF